MKWLIAFVALACLVAVERFKINRHQAYYREKMEAAHFAETAFAMVRAERLKRGAVFDVDTDPAGTGLIGTAVSPVTSTYGDLSAKQTTINPNFGAVLVHMLHAAGVKENDTIAVGMSGSFPALNIAVLAACRAMKLRPLMIVSTSASQWGANDPNFMWLDMALVLREQALFPWDALAATRGGIDDRATAMASASQAMLDAAMERNHVAVLPVQNFDESVEQRLTTFRNAAGSAPITAYVNVGGGTTSVGTTVGKHAFKPGLNLRLPAGAPMVHSVMQAFANEGTPVIHLEGIAHIAAAYGLPVQPATTPAVGRAGVQHGSVQHVFGSGVCAGDLGQHGGLSAHGHRFGPVAQRPAGQSARHRRTLMWMAFDRPVRGGPSCYAQRQHPCARCRYPTHSLQRSDAAPLGALYIVYNPPWRECVVPLLREAAPRVRVVTQPGQQADATRWLATVGVDAEVVSMPIDSPWIRDDAPLQRTEAWGISATTKAAPTTTP